MFDLNSCRLCLVAESSASSIIKCFNTSIIPSAAEDSCIRKTTVSEVLMKHFWFELHGDRDADAFVCISCWNKVDNFHQFYQSVWVLYETNQWQASQLKTIENDVKCILPKLEISMEVVTNIDDNNQHSSTDNINAEDVETSEELLLPKRKRGGRSRKYVSIASSSISLDVPHSSSNQNCELFTRPDAKDQPNDSSEVNINAEEVAPLEVLSFTKRKRLERLNKSNVIASSSISLDVPHCSLKQTSEKAPGVQDQRRKNDELLRQYMSMFCDRCDVKLNTFEEAIKHHKDSHDESGYLMCCGKKFGKKCRAVLHCRWHANPHQFDCTQCGRNFSGIACLRRHIGDHHPSSDSTTSFPCDQCERQFHLQSQLHTHKRLRHTPIELMRFECYQCQKRFLQLSHLRNHLRNTHDNTGPSYVCDVCAKAFHSKWNYELHYALEHGTESLQRQCPECGKWLKHATRLKRHIETNHRQRLPPVACDQCSHVASNRKTLNVHRKLKHGEPAFKCLVCEKPFKQKNALREHMAIHEGIKDLYKCTYCPMTFRSNANRYKHRRSKHAAQLEMDKNAITLATANELKRLKAKTMEAECLNHMQNDNTESEMVA